MLELARACERLSLLLDWDGMAEKDGREGLLGGLGRFYYLGSIWKLSGNLGWRAWAGKGRLGLSGLAWLGWASLG